uniref:Uncharacterized protein n=1 Tax=Geospiza parvula TaxID=87175 RepID=A0A8U8B0V8_GEOPR
CRLYLIVAAVLGTFSANVVDAHLPFPTVDLKVLHKPGICHCGSFKLLCLELWIMYCSLFHQGSGLQ